MTRERMQAPSLEDTRTEWRSAQADEYARHHQAKRALARPLWPLYLKWSARHANLSKLEFMRWLTGEERPALKLYDWLSASHALTVGLDAELGVSDLAVLGRALDQQTRDEIKSRLEMDGIGSLRAEQTKLRDEGHIKLPTAELPAVRSAVQSVSDSETLAAPEALALIVQSYQALPPTIQEAARRSARSGEPLEDAARAVVRQMLDPRAWLASQRCLVPECGQPAQLHHLKLRNDRFRTNELLAPICAYHHLAHSGPDAAHANTQSAWIARHWVTEVAFWEQLAGLYAARLFEDAP